MTEIIGGGGVAVTETNTIIDGGNPDSSFDELFRVVDTARFSPLIGPYAPGAAKPVQMQAIQLALVEFCERTRAWRYVIDAEIAAREECVVAPSYTAIHEIESAYWEHETPLEPVPYGDTPPADLLSATGVPECVTQIAPNIISVVPFQEGTLRLTLNIKPIAPVEYGKVDLERLENQYHRCPEWILQKHGETIAVGALGRPLAIPGQKS
ncbi:UNVERIFIED_CONTAM: hypothetical protein BEN50_21760, partial [Euhalothece sp. KZN 001]